MRCKPYPPPVLFFMFLKQKDKTSRYRGVGRIARNPLLATLVATKGLTLRICYGLAVADANHGPLLGSDCAAGITAAQFLGTPIRQRS